LQVFGAMLQHIASGSWKPGVTLPNEHELAREFGVSSGTIRKALERLEADNLIERRQGRGTFVLDHTQGDLAIRFNNIRDRNGQRIAPASSKLLEQRIGLATLEEQAHLKVSPNDKVLRTRRVSDHEGRPHMYEEASLVMSRLPGLPDEELVGNYLITSLARKYGTLLARATEKLSFAAAAPEIAKLLMVEPCARLLKLDRVVFGISDEPIEWRIALCDLKTEHYLAESR
jgi:GntR family transcriptional regulator